MHFLRQKFEKFWENFFSIFIRKTIRFSIIFPSFTIFYRFIDFYWILEFTTKKNRRSSGVHAVHLRCQGTPNAGVPQRGYTRRSPSLSGRFKRPGISRRAPCPAESARKIVRRWRGSVARRGERARGSARRENPRRLKRPDNERVRRVYPRCETPAFEVPWQRGCTACIPELLRVFFVVNYEIE